MTEPKSAAQKHSEDIERNKLVHRIADNMKVRQWCIEKALESKAMDLQDLKDVTSYFYEFVTKVDDK